MEKELMEKRERGVASGKGSRMTDRGEGEKSRRWRSCG
jgi:hypothetical protein